MAGDCEEGERGNQLRVLEFYSGIGGMRYSMEKAGVHAQIIQAFDINDTANDVYQHNFHHRPSQSNLHAFTPANLDFFSSDAWLLSPPCQPYTRQGLRKHSSDPRASSLLNLLLLLPQVRRLPIIIFLENVVGFETSDSHQRMLQIFSGSGFSTQEFILSPLQFGVPYSRPRYFCLAKRTPSPFFSPFPRIFSEEIVDPVEKFLEFPENGGLEEYYVPPGMVERWGGVMDVVYPESKRCCCFTKSYYRYFKGTGSVLCSEQVESGSSSRSKDSALKNSRVRYFTPREVANLHSFPEDFEFPEHISLRQRYALLGNSLSIAVVAPLLRYLFSS